VSLRRGLAAALIAGIALLAPPAHSKTATAATLPALNHVFVIVMENEPYSAIIGSSAAPYVNGLLRTGGLATNYYAVSHPSLPNYLSLTGGSTYGIASDCTTCWVSATNVADRVESAGKSWKAYEESMPSACYVGDSYPYMQKHDPFIYFNDIRTNTSRCQSHVVPYSQLGTDLLSASTTPSYAFITPNMCDDMHDCSVGTGDSWLSQQVPQILASPAFTTQRSLLVLTWDEDDGGTNQVATVLLGNGITAGLSSSVTYNHYSTLRTVEDGLGLASLNTGDVTASSMSAFYAASPSPSPSPSPLPSPSPTPPPTSPPPAPPPSQVPVWSQVGGTATSGPAASSAASSRLDVFVRGTDQALWHRFWNGSAWSAWESLGGILTSDPSAVSSGSGAIDVFVRGTDNAIWHRSWNGVSWTWWNSVGGIATTRPAIASPSAAHLDLVVRGTDNGLWHRSWNGTVWSAWDSVGGVATSDPSATSSRAGVFDIIVRGTDNGLWHRSWNGAAWGAWDSVGGIATSSAAISSCTAGHLDAFVTGTNGGLWQRGNTGGGWGNWTSVGGQFSTGPAAVCPPGTMAVQLVEVAPNLALVKSTTSGS
jgi:hypothetical protein